MTRERPRPRAWGLGAAVDLPHLSPEEARIIVQILRRLALNIWDAFGDDYESANRPRRT
jgi:hypothetical protein